MRFKVCLQAIKRSWAPQGAHDRSPRQYHSHTAVLTAGKYFPNEFFGVEKHVNGIDKLFEVSQSAAKKFESYNLTQVEKIVVAVAAAAEKATFYAEWALQETGSAGLSTNLCPTGALGTGFWGSSSTHENVGPQHLIQHTLAAYDADETVEMGDIDAAMANY